MEPSSFIGHQGQQQHGLLKPVVVRAAGHRQGHLSWPLAPRGGCTIMGDTGKVMHPTSHHDRVWILKILWSLWICGSAVR